MKKNNKIGYLLALLVLYSNLSYAQEETKSNKSVKLNYLNINNSTALTKFGYNEITQYLKNKEKEKKMKSLASYISDAYRVDIEHAHHIVKTSFVESEKHNIEPMLILSIIGVESNFNPKAVSVVGAVGLTQVMPKYHQSKISKLKKHNLDLFSVKGNIMVGVQIMKEYIALTNGNLPKALQMYNGSLFDKKKSYSKKVFAHLKNFNDVVNV